MAVNAKHRDYDKHLEQWERSRDCYDGQDAVHAKAEKYLPKLKDQPADEYTAYLKRANFFNATFRTVQGLMGMMFRVEPEKSLPPAIEKDLDEDATLDGTPLTLFAQRAATEAVLEGRVGILVDYPESAPGATLADARAQGLRPYMQAYRAEQIINWATGRVGQETVLTKVVLEECADVPDPADEFKAKEEKRWRVLDLGGAGGAYRVRVFRKKATNTQGTDEDEQIGADVFPQMAGKPMTYVPFVIVGPDGVGPAVEPPPLIDLVNTNLSHFRTNADLEHGAHFTGLPTAVVSGYTPDKEGEKLYIGSSAAWTFKDPQAKAEYLEFKGEGLKALVSLLDKKEAQMAVLGARMLEQQRTQVESAQTKKQRTKGEEASLASVAQAVSLGLKIALRWYAEWAGQDPDAVEFELNRDFVPQGLDPAMLTALVSSWQFGAISDRTLFYNLQRGQVVSQETEFETEQAQIADSAAKLMAQGAAAAATAAAAQPVGAQPAAPQDKQPKKTATIKTPKGDMYHYSEG